MGQLVKRGGGRWGGNRRRRRLFDCVKFASSLSYAFSQHVTQDKCNMKWEVDFNF